MTSLSLQQKDHTGAGTSAPDLLAGVPLARPGLSAQGEVRAESVSVVIPAYNEQGAVQQQVEKVKAALDASTLRYEIIVVDDGSEDGTAEAALRTNARVLQHRQNRGYGASLKTGIEAAQYDVIAIIDADGTYPAEEIPALVAQLSTADMVVGARVGNDVHIPWVRRPAKLVLRWLAAHIAGHSIPDLNSGLRVFRRQCVLQYFSILSNRFSFTTTVTLALLSDDYRVVYHPINYYERIGRSKIVPRHFFDFVILVLRMAMMFQPLKVFVPLSFTFGALGLVKVTFDIVSLFLRYEEINWMLLFQPVLSTSAVLLLLVGFQLLLIGMVADGLVRRYDQKQPSLRSQQIWSVELSQPGDGKAIPEKQSPSGPAGAARTAPTGGNDVVRTALHPPRENVG